MARTYHVETFAPDSTDVGANNLALTSILNDIVAQGGEVEFILPETSVSPIQDTPNTAGHYHWLRIIYSTK